MWTVPKYLLQVSFEGANVKDNGAVFPIPVKLTSVTEYQPPSLSRRWKMTGPQGKKICVKVFFCSASSSNKNACFLEIKTHIFAH